MNQHYYDNEDFVFLKQKIETIRIALFKAEINSALQLPNNVIQILKAEDDGTLWFITSCSGDHAKTIDRNFYAYLDFYRKGADCRLQVSGKANIVENDYDFSNEVINYSDTLNGKLVLVKMKIMQAEYFENKSEPAITWKDKFKMAFHHLFLSTPHKTYNFS